MQCVLLSVLIAKWWTMNSIDCLPIFARSLRVETLSRFYQALRNRGTDKTRPLGQFLAWENGAAALPASQSVVLQRQLHVLLDWAQICFSASKNVADYLVPAFNLIGGEPLP
jgi:hypothetical protein